MKKIYITSMALGALIFLGTGCNLITPKAVDCGSDKICANKLLTECKSGTFRLQQGIEQLDKSEPKYTILSKAGAGCDVSWEIPGSPEVLSGSMKCNIPESVTGGEDSAKKIGEYIISSKFANCSGELFDKLNKPVSEVPGLSPEGQQCGDNSACAELLIRGCQKGTFLVSTSDNSEFEFSLVNSSPTGCFADIKSIKNSNQSLVGKQMRCIMSPAPASLDAARSFVNSIVKDKISGGSCSGLLFDALHGNYQNTSAANLPPANLPKIISPKTTGGIDCGSTRSNGTKCVADIVDNCKQGTFITDDNGLADITGVVGTEIRVDIQGKIDSKCMGIVRFIKYPNSALVGPEMTCVFPGYVNGFMSIGRNIYTRWRDIDPSNKVLGALCEGPLFKLLNP